MYRSPKLMSRQSHYNPLDLQSKSEHSSVFYCQCPLQTSSEDGISYNTRYPTSRYCLLHLHAALCVIILVMFGKALITGPTRSGACIAHLAALTCVRNSPYSVSAISSWKHFLLIKCWSGPFSIAAKDWSQHTSLSPWSLLICSRAMKSMDGGVKLWGWYFHLTKY